MSDEYYSTTFCVECGPDVKVDEDGCCASCGGAATGPYAEKYRELEARLAAIEGLSEKLARALLERGTWGGHKAQRIQFMGGKYGIKEIPLGGLGYTALEDFFKITIAAILRGESEG